MKQNLSNDQKIYTNDFVMIRVDKLRSHLSNATPFNRWDPKFWNPEHQSILDEITNSFKTKPLGEYIGFITYGQVGRRELDKKGTVRYIQTINITDTGIDYFVKPDHIKSGSWNDLDRSRLKKYDVLLGNSGMGGLGKVAIFLDDKQVVNISQDIDILRLKDINPFYIAAFLKCKYGNKQIWYRSKGVGFPKFPFDEVKSILVPIVPSMEQDTVEKMYIEMNKRHTKAISLRENKIASYKVEFNEANELLRIMTEYIEGIIIKQSR